VPRRFVDALHTLALAGAAFPRELVAHVGGADLAPFLTSCGLWVERGTLLRFDHGLLHQSMRHEAERRRDFAYLERRLAKAWMRYGEQQGVDVATEVARHAHAGEDWALAVDQGLVAAEKAWHIGDTKELWDASSLAEDAANRDPTMADRLPRTTFWMARAAQAVGEVQLASERYLHARALAVEHGDVNAALKAQLGLAWAALQLGDLGAAESLYQEVYQRARKEKSGTLESEAIAGLAWIEQQKRNFEGASILFTRLGNRCAQLDDTRGAGEALLGQGYVSRRVGEWDEANEFYQEALEHWESHDEFVGMARAHLGLGEVARQLRRNDAAEQHFRDAMRIADELGATTLGMEARFGLADLYRHQGAVDRAAAIYEQHVRWAQRQKLFEAEVLGHHGLALAALELGDTRRCYEATTDAARCLAGAPAHWLWASYRLIVATLLTMRGEGEEAYRWLWAASDLGLADTVDRDVATCLSRIADESERSGWINPLRVAGKLGIDQWQRLRSGEPARRLQEQLARAG
jgi:tetratricopeptide (TPR) repeat protein